MTGVAAFGESVDVCVIDEELLADALRQEQESTGGQEEKVSYDIGDGGKDKSALAIPAESKEGNICIEDAQVLKLSYKNIFKIDNLDDMSKLHTLCLDNNVIEEIQGLDTLVNLEWLDLSFNNISKIQGLDSLRKLRDLSLCNNKIEVVENLDQCTQLECLSLGNNQISKLEHLIKLRQFHKLHLLVIEGNPACKDPECRMLVLAHIPQLKYLNFSLIQQKDATLAREQYQDELLEAEEREALEEETRKAADIRGKYMQGLREANLLTLETLYDEMFESDKELPKLEKLPGFEAIIESYVAEFRLKADGSIKSAMDQFEKMLAETALYTAAVTSLVTANKERSIALTEEYVKVKKKLFASARSGSVEAKQSHSVQEIRELLQRKVGNLCDELMSIEMYQVEQLTSLRDSFEDRSTLIKTEMLEIGGDCFRAVEDLENSWFTAVEALATSLIEKLISEDLDDPTDDLIDLLSDKDSLLVSVQGAHDTHLGKLLEQEDRFRENVNAYFASTLAAEKEKHTKANRTRIIEIMEIRSKTEEDLNELEEELAEEDD